MKSYRTAFTNSTLFQYPLPPPPQKKKKPAKFAPYYFFPINKISLIFPRVSFSHTIGRDSDSDGRPDIPLRYEVEDSESVVQFPLGFCPGDRSNASDLQRNFKCVGEWGIVIKVRRRRRLYWLFFRCCNQVLSG